MIGEMNGLHFQQASLQIYREVHADYEKKK